MKARRILSRLAILVVIVLVGVLGFYLFRILRDRFFPTRQEVTLSYWGLWEDPDGH